MPPLQATAAAAQLRQPAARAAQAAASVASSARPASTDYVAYTHNEVHGSRIWTWDGRSSINLIFVVALLLGLVVLFLSLIVLSRVLAHTRAPSHEAVLPFRRPGPARSGPRDSALPAHKLPPSDPLPLPGPNKAMYARASAPADSATASPASSGHFFVEPLLPSAAPTGAGEYATHQPRRHSGRTPSSSLRPSEGPPPARLDSQRNSRYTRRPALNHHRPRGSSSCSNDGPLGFSGQGQDSQDMHRAPSGARRVQSIGRGNSLRYSRSRDVEDDTQAQLGRQNSARLAAQAGGRRSHSGRRASRPTRTDRVGRLSREAPYRDYPASSDDESPGSSYFQCQATYRDDDSATKSQRASTSNGTSEETPLEGLPPRRGRRGWGYGTPEAPSPQ